MRRTRNAQAKAIELALASDGLVRYSEFRSAGLTEANIASLVVDSVMRRVVHGIYLVGLPLMTQQQLWRCAEMIGGTNGALTARSTFEVRDAIRPRADTATIATTRRNDSPDHLEPEVSAADRARDQQLFVAGDDVQRYLREPECTFTRPASR